MTLIRVALFAALALIAAAMIVFVITRDVSAQGRPCFTPLMFAEMLATNHASVIAGAVYPAGIGDALFVTFDGSRVMLWGFKEGCLVSGPVPWDTVVPKKGKEVEGTPA